MLARRLKSIESTMKKWDKMFFCFAHMRVGELEEKLDQLEEIEIWPSE